MGQVFSIKTNGRREKLQGPDVRDTVVTEAESFIYDCESCDDGDVNGLQSSVHIKMFRRTSVSLLRWRSVTFHLCDMSKVPNSSRVVAV